MCKCCQNCLETCYWHLIEKRFCYDENIALYEAPEKEEKNNNFFDNMAFYDSVSVIAGRAVVTIDPLPEKKQPVEEKPIIQQPTFTRKLRWENDDTDLTRILHMSKSVPAIFEKFEETEDINKSEDEKEPIIEKKPEEKPEEKKSDKSKLDTLKPENLDGEVEVRRKSLKDRRMSKSLYLKIEQPKEIPIIRQQSMPKFYLDTPADTDQSSILRSSSTALTSPVPRSHAFVYDLYSVVQMERERVQSENSQVPVHRKESDRASRILHIRDKIRLRRVKSSLGTPITNLPHSHHHM